MVFVTLSSFVLRKNVKKVKQIRLSQTGIWTLGFRTICVLSKSKKKSVVIFWLNYDYDKELFLKIYEKAVWIVQNLNSKFNHVVCGTAVAGRTLRDGK